MDNFDLQLFAEDVGGVEQRGISNRRQRSIQ